MLDPHADDVEKGRAERDCQERPLKSVPSVSDRAHRSVNDKLVALDGDRMDLGGVVSCNAGSEQPLAICKFHGESKSLSF